MLSQAIYSHGGRRVTISVERVDTWIEDTGSIINFPGLVELGGDRFYMSYHRGRHGGVEPLRAVISDDAGETWSDAPADYPLIMRRADNGQNYQDFASGLLGYLRDGSTARIDTYPREYLERTYDRSMGPFHDVMRADRPHFIWQRWVGDAQIIETHEFEVQDLPWTSSGYENYGTIVELDDGALMAPFLATPLKPGSSETRAHVALVHSTDRGQTWRCAHVFDPDLSATVYGIVDREVEAGFSEPDLIQLANGDLLCIFRTGSYSPMFQARSADGGRSWSTPVNTGWPCVKPRLELLPNGVLACASGRGGYGHPQVTHVMLSLDGTGNRWELPFAFHTGPGCSYTSTMQRDGKLHVVYSHSDFTRDFGTNQLPKQTIKRVVLDVQAA